MNFKLVPNMVISSKKIEYLIQYKCLISNEIILEG